MTKKHESNKDELNRTDELINDYLRDVFGESGECVRHETVPMSTFFENASADGVSLKAKATLSVSIQHNRFLVPTIKLLSSNAYSQRHSKVQAIFILLSALYFLRRPLSPRVRQCFLTLSEQVINDYHFSEFKQRMTRQSVFS